jgi:cytochrome b involved in lipid metabolism
MEFFKDVIQKTIIHVQKNKTLDILGISDVSSCIERLGELSKKIKELTEMKKTNSEGLINGLQFINNELSGLLKSYGTDSLEDLILICLGNNNKIVTNENENNKFELLKKYFHPTSYKILINKKHETETNKNSICDSNLNEKSQNLDTVNVSLSTKSFHLKVHGIQVVIHNSKQKTSLLINGTVDDICIDVLNSTYVNKKIRDIIMK